MAKDYILGGQKPAGIAISNIRAAYAQLIPRTQPIVNPSGITPIPEFEVTDDVKLSLQDGGNSLYGLSELGTAVYSQVTFGSAVGENADETHLYTGIDGLTYSIPKITFQAILISVSFPRNIVKTAIQGRNGTVKEYIGEGDAQISFRGIITGKNGHYPTDEVNALKALVNAPVTIPVISDYLNRLDIYNIVFEERSFEQEEGGYSYQTFTLNAVSDATVNLHIV